MNVSVTADRAPSAALGDPSPQAIRGAAAALARKAERRSTGQAKRLQTLATQAPTYRPCGCGCKADLSSLRASARFISTAHRMKAFRAAVGVTETRQSVPIWVDVPLSDNPVTPNLQIKHELGRSVRARPYPPTTPQLVLTYLSELAHPVWTDRSLLPPVTRAPTTDRHRCTACQENRADLIVWGGPAGDWAGRGLGVSYSCLGCWPADSALRWADPPGASDHPTPVVLRQSKADELHGPKKLTDEAYWTRKALDYLKPQPDPVLPLSALAARSQRLLSRPVGQSEAAWLDARQVSA